MGGRRPKPAALRVLQGNRGHRPIPTDEPVAVPGWPDQPPKLGKVAAAEWDRLAHLLDGEQRLGKADGPHLMGAAIAYETALEFQKRSKQRGLPHDEWRKFKTGERMQWGEYRKFLNDLCISQGTRARAKTGGRGKEAGKLGNFFGRHGKAAAPDR